MADRDPSSTRHPAVGTLSVIIPTLNEAAYLEATLARVPSGADVIVADGGSVDGTQTVAARRARVVTAPRGRASQMNAGADLATGDVLLFLHADTLLPDNAEAAIHDALTDSGVVGGCFRAAFDQDGFWLRLWSHPVWMKWHRLAFGDRAPFVRRSAFDRIGGFPEQPVFEDLELVRRLRQDGRFVFRDESVVTSARRFREHGSFRQQAHNLALWSAWNLRLPPSWVARYYRYGQERG